MSFSAHPLTTSTKNSSNPAPGTNLSKACDNCSRRKIRCDKVAPCSNCLRFEFPCTVTPRVARSKRQRESIAEQVAGKISLLDERIRQIDRLVLELAGDSPLRPAVKGCVSSIINTPLPIPNSPIDRSSASLRGFRVHKGLLRHELGHQAPDDNKEVAVGVGHLELEGLSALSAHTSFATKFIQKLIDKNEGDSLSSDTRDLLNDLKNTVEAVHKSHKSLASRNSTHWQNPGSDSSQHKRNMMPLGVVLRMIWNPCAENAFLLKCLSTLMPSKRLADLFLDVYSDPSLDQYLFIIANFILYGMTKCEKSDITQDQAYHRKICAQNIESGLAALPLFLPRTHSVALALVLGCIYWMENSEPHLAWTSVVAASETSQSLGYHKQGLGSDIGSDEPNSSGLLFWLIYFNEKTLSLRLGRTSTIPEEDITIPPPGGNHQSGPIMFYCQIQIRVARAAGKIYSDLYSAYSLTMSPSYRRAKVKVLEREIQALQKASAFNQERLRLLSAYEELKPLFSLIFASDDVLSLSMMTLIHRASPVESSQPFMNQCLEYARATLNRFNSFDKIKTPTILSYINWTVLLLPFLPFFVLFCNAVEYGNKEDLECLNMFVQSLGVASDDSGLANHHRLFGAFYTLARHYVERRNGTVASWQERQILNQQMEAFLGSLGFSSQGFNSRVDLVDPSQGFDASDTMPPPRPVQRDYDATTVNITMPMGDGGEILDQLQDPTGQFSNIDWFAMN